MKVENPGKALLIVLDGFGIGKDSPFNAIRNARKPFFDSVFKKYPHSELFTHGHAVGLPNGVMGNSEVGHGTMGAGRILYQDLTRISNTIEDKKFASLPRLKTFFRRVQESKGRVHFMGLLSDGGVHSHIDHLKALLESAAEERTPEVFIHAFLDGRDTSPDSSPQFLSAITTKIESLKASAPETRIQIASLCGRFFAMDRDQRWERVEKAYRLITGDSPNPLSGGERDWKKVVEASYALQVTDEFFEPSLLSDEGIIRDGDGVFFFNYRSDRAREITQAFIEDSFSGFPRRQKLALADYLGMTQYDSKSSADFLFGPQSSENLFGSWLEGHQKKQLRLAETEKYAHVTFFFNGGREKPFTGEDRILVASPKEVATYDLKPEMSAYEVAEKAKTALESNQYDFVLMNFANADMVGHTGNYEAALRAIETLDQCVERVIGAAEKNGFHTLLTADHGNAEEMRECIHDHDGDHYQGIHTQHTLNPVPALWVPPNSAQAPRADRGRLKDGTLADVMPTLCDLMNLNLPTEVTGKSLL
jgi:2,3-bisphosphoglycerate-independent phosphoglycerate mutase